MAVQKLPSPVEVDLEATAELPAIDFGPEETAVATDVFPLPVVPAGVVELADSLREVEQRLQRKGERVAALEASLATAKHDSEDLQAQLTQTRSSGAEREAALRTELAAAAQRAADTQRANAELQSTVGELRAQLQTQRAALGESQAQADERANAQRHQERELQDMRRRAAQQLEALSTWQGYRAVSESMLAEREEQLRDIDTRHAVVTGEMQSRANALQSELATAAQQSAAIQAGLEDELSRARGAQQVSATALQASTEQAAALTTQLVDRDAVVATLQGQLDELRAIEEKARHGAGVHDEQVRQIAMLQIELSAAQERQRDTDKQLHAASERVRRLESEAHASAALMGNLQQNIERLGREDTGSRPALLAPPLEPALRVLVRLEGGSEVVYPLGRRTTVGRTPENDIQVDTTFVSRHHAVLLSNTDHCIVEDLNSTNGVQVNGRRVGRQILHDGDMVTVGRTEFRYQQRS